MRTRGSAGHGISSNLIPARLDTVKCPALCQSPPSPAFCTQRSRRLWIGSHSSSLSPITRHAWHVRAQRPRSPTSNQLMMRRKSPSGFPLSTPSILSSPRIILHTGEWRVLRRLLSVRRRLPREQPRQTQPIRFDAFEWARLAGKTPGNPGKAQFVFMTDRFREISDLHVFIFGGWNYTSSIPLSLYEGR